ncbi:MAG: hypothetical protein DHS20C15_29240 [Planctomycetota bacterium]|nr:MAG: hypothetical protein DHS20C15_29240 [Planctomycetota bacterium]
MSAARNKLCGLLHALGALALLGLLISKAVLRPLSHDEHQFVAPAALWWREGLLPYLDYPHFHAPYSVFLNALPMALSDHLLLGVRVLSALCAFGFLLLLHRALHSAARRRGLTHGLWLADAAVVLAVAQPLFAYTTALAWNHDNALLTAFAGLLVAAAALRRGGCGRRLLLAGLLLAVSAGLRLSMAPLGLCLVIGVALCATPERRTRAVLLTVLGGLLGSLPFLVLVALAPSAAWFGNIEYASLNTLFREQQGFELAMTLTQKLSWLKQAVLTHPAAVALELFALWSLWRVGPSGWRAARREQPELLLALVFLPGLWLGALAATPAWPQYFFASMIWLVPLAAWASLQTGHGLATRWWLPLAAAVALVSGAHDWHTQLVPPTRHGQGALAVHAAGEELAALIGSGRVLTRAPILPLEGGARIDAALAGGPFGWRVEPLLDETQRDGQGLLGPTSAHRHLERDLPAALLLLDDDEPRKLDSALELGTWEPQILSPTSSRFGLTLLTPPEPEDR